ncbi:hypothetical protein V1514DRAFT_333138 [Lipomyces japonicus]|uniref:uncharacterized protein n=1 Tax=Lipomyces japonicus TaxID=56871 RepID=UPI0034D00A7E
MSTISRKLLLRTQASKRSGNTVKAYFDIAGLEHDGAVCIPDSFQLTESAQIKEYKRIFAALAKNDTFQIWASYLSLRKIYRSSLETSGYARDGGLPDGMFVDRALISNVFLSLKPKTMIYIRGNNLRPIKNKFTLSKFKGVDSVVPEEWPPKELPSLDKQTITKYLKPILLETTPNAPSQSITKQFKLEKDSKKVFWERLQLIKNDIETMFGELSQMEKNHLFNCTTSIGTLEQMQDMWDNKLDTTDVYTWNTFIATVCRTKSSQLKLVDGIGDIKLKPDKLAENLKKISEKIAMQSKKSKNEQIDSETSIFLGADSRNIRLSAVQQLSEAGDSALQLVNSMYEYGIYPNTVTYEILILAFSKSGRLADIEKFIETIWFVNRNTIDEFSQNDSQKVEQGSRLYPTNRTITAIFNAFTRNYEPKVGERIINGILWKYKIEKIGAFVDVVNEYLQVYAKKNHRVRTRKVNGKVQIEYVLNQN